MRLYPLTEVPITLFKRHVLLKITISFLLSATATFREEVHVTGKIATAVSSESSAALECPDIPEIYTAVSFT